MNYLFDNMGQFMDAVLFRGSFIISSSVFILAIISIRAVFRKKASMRLQYALWLLVAVKLLAVPVLQVESPISVQKLFGPWERMLQQRLYGTADGSRPDSAAYAQWEHTVAAQPGSIGYIQWGKTDGENQGAFDLHPSEHIGADGQRRQGFGERPGMQRLFACIACAGSVALSLYFLFGNLRFAIYLHKNRMRFSGCRFPLPLYLVEGLPSPCLYGRAVYITPDLTVDEKRLSHVLAHEYSHYRQGDLIWPILRCLCLVFYWWNPLVWVAAYLSKQDCEFACDEAAVALLGPRERIPYGRTLVGLVAVKAKPDKYFHSMFIASTMMGGRNMKQRIQRIAQKPKTVLSVCLLAVFLSVVCFVSASTAKPSKKVPVSAKESGIPDKGMDAEEASAGKMDASKVSAEGEDENPPAGGDVESHVQVKEPDGKQAVFDLDEAVGLAVLAFNEDAVWKRECAAQGHQILDYVQADGQVTVYALTMYGEYGFNDGYFIKDSGTGVIPAVIRFSFDDTRGYELEDFQIPMDGGKYFESIHELFPEDLWEKCHSYSEETIAALTKMEQSYARKYLKKIGRKAPVGTYSDSDHPLLTDAGVSVEVSNKLCDDVGTRLSWKYPDWIGNTEEIEDGVRYVYEMALDKKAGVIIFTKSVYETGEVVEQFRFDMYTGDEI